MQVVLRTAAVRLRAAADVRALLARRSAGRPLVVGAVMSRVRGWRVGDLTLGFEAAREPLDYVEIDAIDGVRVVVDRRLVALLRRGASIVRDGVLQPDGLAIRLRHPEDWLDYLEGRPLPAGR